MESDDEDPFCYRSLKRTKINQEQTDQCRSYRTNPSIASTKNSSTGNRKRAVKSSEKMKKKGVESQKGIQPKFEIETVDAYDYVCKSKAVKGHKDHHQLDNAKSAAVEIKRSKTKMQFSASLESCSSEQEHQILTSETVLKGSMSNLATNKYATICTTTKPTEQLCQNSPKDNIHSTESFENGDPSFIHSEISVKQDSKCQMKTDARFPKQKSPKPPDVATDKIGRNVAEKSHGEKECKDSEEGRCPFCQMPFQALTGQSLSWHTMECMDLPLKTTQECPAGLTCDSTVPSHYRRYAHSLLALHFAGQHQDSNSAISDSPEGTGRHSEPKQETLSYLPRASENITETKRTSPEETQRTSQKAKSRKRKRPSSKSKNDHSASGTSPSQSLSQSSQNSSASNSSIKDYFSPTKKKTDTCDNSRPHENSNDRVSVIESDPVLRLLVALDSDGDENLEKNDEDNLKDDETHEENLDCDVQKSNHQSSHLHKSKHTSENVCDLVNTIKEDIGCGFLAQEQDDEESVTDNIDADKTPMEKSDKSDVHIQALSENKIESQQICPTAHPSTATISAAPFGMQKQTSLFSFFKPQCHSATVSKRTPAKRDMPAAPKLPFTNTGPERNKRRSWQAGTGKPVLTKSASEPVKMTHVSLPSQNGISLTNNRQQRSAGESAVQNSSSFKNSSGRQCPFYKRLPGTAITVDAFSYGEIVGCQAYVLTHFHYDHYQGLTKRFSQPLFCSQVTGNLVEKQIGVNKKWINRLPLNKPCQVAGVWATLMEANHCPGAVIILFELPNGKKLLHTGDFRANPCMEEYPPLVSVIVDELYLDTTYCDPAFAFPSQKDAIEFAVSTALKAIARDPWTLIVCGAYTIGKERIFIALAEALQTKICVQSAKKQVLDCLEDARLKEMVSLNWTDGSVHVLPMRQLNAQGLGKHLRQCPQFSSVLAFEPTGWTHSNKTLSLDNLRPKFTGRGITVYGVPYSEHSSFLEMKRFVQFLRPKRILPTVNNGNPTSRRKMEAFFSQWLSERTSQSQQGSANSTAQPSLGSWLSR